MKTFQSLLLAASLALLPQGSWALSLEQIPHWTHARSDTVQWVPPHNASVSLHVIGSDDEHWAMLSVKVDVDYALASQASQMLKAQYPTKKLHRSFARAADDWQISIPLLGKSQIVDAPVGPSEIPWAQTMIFLSKPEYQRLKSRVKLEEVSKWLELRGAMTSQINELRVVETLELDATTTCKSLASSGESLGERLLRFAHISNEIEKMGRHAASREALREQVLRNCIEISPQMFRSFAELLDSRASTQLPSGKLVGEAQEERRVQKVYPLSFVISFSENS